MHDGEEAEEERPTHDAVVEPDSHASLCRAEALLENMSRDQIVALVNERWMDASQIQTTISALPDATAGDDPESLSVRVVRDIRHVFQRLFRTHRKRGSDERMESFRTYVENMSSLMG